MTATTDSTAPGSDNEFVFETTRRLFENRTQESPDSLKSTRIYIRRIWLRDATTKDAR